MRKVQEMIDGGNEEAALVFEAMALNTAKNIAKIAPTVDGKIDFIILTGGTLRVLRGEEKAHIME